MLILKSKPNFGNVRKLTALVLSVMLIFSMALTCYAETENNTDTITVYFLAPDFYLECGEPPVVVATNDIISDYEIIEYPLHYLELFSVFPMVAAPEVGHNVFKTELPKTTTYYTFSDAAFSKGAAYTLSEPRSTLNNMILVYDLYDVEWWFSSWYSIDPDSSNYYRNAEKYNPAYDYVVEEPTGENTYYFYAPHSYVESDCTPYAYWYEPEEVSEWPGVEMESVPEIGKDVFKITTPKTCDHIVFNNGKNRKTDNILLTMHNACNPYNKFFDSFYNEMVYVLDYKTWNGLDSGSWYNTFSYKRARMIDEYDKEGFSNTDSPDIPDTPDIPDIPDTPDYPISINVVSVKFTFSDGSCCDCDVYLNPFGYYECGVAAGETEPFSISVINNGVTIFEKCIDVDELAISIIAEFTIDTLRNTCDKMFISLNGNLVYYDDLTVSDPYLEVEYSQIISMSLTFDSQGFPIYYADITMDQIGEYYDVMFNDGVNGGWWMDYGTLYTPGIYRLNYNTHDCSWSYDLIEEFYIDYSTMHPYIVIEDTDTLDLAFRYDENNSPVFYRYVTMEKIGKNYSIMCDNGMGSITWIGIDTLFDPGVYRIDYDARNNNWSYVCTEKIYFDYSNLHPCVTLNNTDILDMNFRYDDNNNPIYYVDIQMDNFDVYNTAFIELPVDMGPNQYYSKIIFADFGYLSTPGIYRLTYDLFNDSVWYDFIKEISVDTSDIPQTNPYVVVNYTDTYDMAVRYVDNNRVLFYTDISINDLNSYYCAEYYDDSGTTQWASLGNVLAPGDYRINFDPLNSNLWFEAINVDYSVFYNYNVFFKYVYTDELTGEDLAGRAYLNFDINQNGIPCFRTVMTFPQRYTDYDLIFYVNNDRNLQNLEVYNENTVEVTYYPFYGYSDFTFFDNEPDTPDVSDISDHHDTPDVSDISDHHDTPDVSDIPDQHDTSDCPCETNDEPDTPDIPDTVEFCPDVNGDGIVTAADAMLLLRVSIGKEKISSPTLVKMFDADKDGVITSIDAVIVLRIAIGLNYEIA